MEVDINEAKSRQFNLLLRFFQFGLQIFVSSYISKVDNVGCSSTFVTISIPISYVLLIFNIIALAVTRCRDNYSRILFFIALGANFIMVGVVMVIGFSQIGESNSCANNKIIHRYAGFQALLCLIICGLIIRGPFELSQRYSNTPGNAVWIFLFFGYSWTHTFSGSMIAIGVFNLLITLSSVAVNIIPFFVGLTSQMKKGLLFQWLGSLAFMIICEIIALAAYLSNSDKVIFNDVVAIKLIQTYLPINAIDFLFWVWGLMTLAYANGDKVRDILLSGDNGEDVQVEEDDGHNIGTLK